jgi:hypothetical protein
VSQEASGRGGWTKQQLQKGFQAAERETRRFSVLGLMSTITNSTHGNAQHNAYGHYDIGHMTQNIGPFGPVSLSVTYTSSRPSPCNLFIPRNLVPLILFGLSSRLPLINVFHVSLVYKVIS